ncbi:hypothetical protein Tco_0542514 [Tanacetum coccineum]
MDSQYFKDKALLIEVKMRKRCIRFRSRSIPLQMMKAPMLRVAFSMANCPSTKSGDAPDEHLDSMPETELNYNNDPYHH